MIFRIVMFKIIDSNPQYDATFRSYFTPIKEINDRHGCEKISILKGPELGTYAYISVWRDAAALDFLKKSPEYVAFVSELLKYADIVYDKIYDEQEA